MAQGKPTKEEIIRESMNSPKIIDSIIRFKIPRSTEQFDAAKHNTDKYLILLTGFFSNNEEHSIEHFCQQVDWVYDIIPLKCARKISSDRSRISHYAAKKILMLVPQRQVILMVYQKVLMN